jgi:serine/threonine protein kinase
MPASSTLVAGRYRLGAELGSGGMGVVWEAYDELLHRTVAVKEIRYPFGVSDEDREKLARRTLREARAVAAVEDPHAVRVFDIVEQDGRPWIVMELVRGRTLTEILRQDGPLPVPEVARIGLALLDALQTAHAAGVLHRDVKPSNVIVGVDGRVALTDFGIATVDSDPTGVTTSGQLVGSPAYMAPERARGEKPTAASDLWSLGATLWTAAEGQPPYDEGTAFATMTKVVTEDPPTCVRCEGPLGGVLAALMSREPSARPTIAQARQRLTAAAHAAKVPVAPYPTEPLPPSFDRTVALHRPVTTAAPATAAPAVALPVQERRSRWPAALLSLLLVAGVIAAAVALTRNSGSGAPAAATPPQPKHSASSSASASASASTKPSSNASTASTAGLPSGWHRYTDSSVGWSIGVPPGWQVQPSGSEVFVRDPAGGRYLQLDTKYPAGPSAKGAWEDQERAFRASHSGYQRILLDNISWRSYPDVADWEFTYTSGAATLHAVDRGAVVANRGYGLFFQTHDNQWAASQDLRQGFYDSFQPGR